MNSILSKIKKGIDSTINNIKSFKERCLAPQIERADPAKLCGNEGEYQFYRDIRCILPNDIKILTNINIVVDNRVIGEIDFLIVYNNKIFAVEVKHYVGHIYAENGMLMQDKENGEIKAHTMPIRQLSGNIYKLKKSINAKDIWINEIVYFVDNDWIDLPDEFVWFNDIDDITEYIVNNGKSTSRIAINKFLHNLVCGDVVIGLNDDRVKQCRVVRESLHLKTKDNADYLLDLNQVSHISIKHKLNKDELDVIMCDGIRKTFKAYNNYLTIKDHENNEFKYNFSKLNEIHLSEKIN